MFFLYSLPRLLITAKLTRTHPPVLALQTATVYPSSGSSNGCIFCRNLLFKEVQLIRPLAQVGLSTAQLYSEAFRLCSFVEQTKPSCIVLFLHGMVFSIFFFGIPHPMRVGNSSVPEVRRRHLRARGWDRVPLQEPG